MTTAAHRRARTFRDVLEPVIGGVFFSPECHAQYESLGFQPSPLTSDGVALPDGVAYFGSRGASMGRVAGEVVAAAFAVFNPAAVVPAIDMAWAISTPEDLVEARVSGAVAQLRRILGDPPEVREVADALIDAVNGAPPAGRPLYAGTLSMPYTGEDDWRDLFVAGDRIREYRGDSHTAAWTAAGFDAVEIGLLTELFWGLPMRSYLRTRAWNDTDMDDAVARLRARSLIDDGAFTDAGRMAREAVEATTDEQMLRVTDRLGDDFDRVNEVLRAWSRQIIDAGGYLRSAKSLTG
ncbi:MAG TPA: hypothetical protein VMW08_03270 [Acidimicrobiales bacterium]|nr:hypothetical protein [Acidimicrobiales bacterium]